MLDALEQAGFVSQYTVDGVNYGHIPAFVKHQMINQREAKSTIPEPPEEAHVHARASQNIAPSVRTAVFLRDGHQCLRCGVREQLTIDHIFPRSIGGTNAIANLRTLCRSCNSGRPVAGDALVEDLAKDNLTLADMQRTCVHVQAPGEGKGREGKGIDSGALPRSAPKAAPKAPKPKAWRFVPDDWQPNEAHQAKAVELGVILRREVDSFRAHEFTKPKTNADLAFHAWLIRAAQFATSSGGGRPAYNEPPQQVYRDL